MLREGDLKSEKYMKRTPRKRQADSSPLSSSISEIGLSDHGGIKGVGVDSEVGSIPVHIDLQIHISSDLSLDQIDAVFQSMAKHLYGKEK